MARRRRRRRRHEAMANIHISLFKTPKMLYVYSYIWKFFQRSNPNILDTRNGRVAVHYSKLLFWSHSTLSLYALAFFSTTLYVSKNMSSIKCDSATLHHL